MGQYVSTTGKKTISCSVDTALKTAWDVSDGENVNQTIVLTQDVEDKSLSGEVTDRWTRNTELTALTIACLLCDVKLVRKLISNGADVNVFSKGDRHSNFSNSVPPIYCCAINKNVDIAKLLLDAGADVNLFQGPNQFINLQEPPDTRAIIGPDRYRTGYCGLSERTATDPNKLIEILELYLQAGVKLNSTSWGPCLFLGRGKVYEANLLTTIDIDRPWYICTTAITLLQHGINPNLYSLPDVVQQLRVHHRFHRPYNKCTCIKEQVLLRVFLSAGYKYTKSDMDYLERCHTGYPLNKEDAADIMKTLGPLSSLKNLVRSTLRNYIVSINGDTTIFLVIDKLELPKILKDYIKLYDVVPSNIHTVSCCEHKY